MRFAHLHTHTHYSLLDGLTRVDELVARVKELGMESVAITDHGVMYGAVEFYQKAKKAGIKPIIGCEMYVTENMYDKRPSGTGKSNGNYFHLILLAENDVGYKNLIKLVSAAHLDGFYYKPRVDKNLLHQHHEGLIALSACLGGEIARALLSSQYDKAKRIALEYKEIFGKDNYFLEIQQHPNIEDQGLVNKELIKLSKETGIELVATQDSHYCRSEDAHAHDVLLAVQTGNEVNDKDRLTLRNDDFSILSPEKMAEKFTEVPEAIENTIKIAERCNVEIQLGPEASAKLGVKSVGETQLPSYPLPDGRTYNSYLRELAEAGLTKRYSNELSVQIQERLDYELGIIEKTGFASYFLIVQDFVNWAKNRGIIVGPGRGSAAGSLVSYLLGITNLDPLKYNLLFERFLNPERVSMPDIDLDFDDARRGEVFDYVREKYGSDHFAQVITFGTMAARGGIRDAGRALGFSYDFCDRIAKLIPFNPNQNEKIGFLKKCLEDVDELKQVYNTTADAKTVIDAAMKLEGVARHSSTHACAVVITPKPLIEYLPLQRATDGDEVITQYEMNTVADLGLLKMDFLGLSNLTIIHDTLQLIERNYGIKIDIETIPLDDKKTFELLREGRTTGVFQLEGSGMRRYFKQLKPTRFEDIIVMISLYRPGPLDAGMVEEYIQRKHGKKPVTYLHPLLKPILENTYGIIVYQEQLMQLANTLAKFTLPQGYVLIKAVGKKIRSLLEEQREKLIDGMVKNDIDQATAQKLWDFIEPFARYGFNKSHAACYAMIGYQTAYLKALYPVEFMAALMNSASGDIERTAFLIEECQSMGIEVLPPEINESHENFVPIYTSVNRGSSISQSEIGTIVPMQPVGRIRFGLAAVKNVGVNIVQAIINKRESGGQFKNIEDFTARVQDKDLNKKSLESLIKCGALEKFGERAALLASVDQLLYYSRESRKAQSTGQISLFAPRSSTGAMVDLVDLGGGSEVGVALPPLRLAVAEPVSRAEKLMWEKELLGLFITDHPLKDYQQQLNFEKGLMQIKDLPTSRSNSNVKIGGMVTKIQKILTKSGKPMVFSWIEDLTGKIETVVFPNVLEANPEAFVENKVLVISGKLNDRDGIPKLLCDTVRPLVTLN